MSLKINSIFDWLKHINEYKTPVSAFSQADWDVFNSYMIHRFMSMHSDIGLLAANEAQKLQPTDKKGVYSFYVQYISKNSKFIRYQKSKTKSTNTDLLIEISSHFNLSQREAKDYITLLDKQEIVRILTQRGNDKKTIKKLLK